MNALSLLLRLGGRHMVGKSTSTISTRTAAMAPNMDPRNSTITNNTNQRCWLTSSSSSAAAEEVVISKTQASTDNQGGPDSDNNKKEEKVSTASCGDIIDSDNDSDDDGMEQEEMFVDPHESFEYRGKEWGGPRRGGRLPEPTRFGDWERKGRCSDF